MLKRIHQFFATKSRRFILVVGCLLIALVALLDYGMGSGFEVGIFYLIPIFVLTWYASTPAGIIAAVLATLIWAMVHAATGRVSLNLAVNTWNTLIEFGIFLIGAILLSRLKRQTQQLEELASQDLLTGVANRRSFYQAAETEIKRCQRYGSVFTFAYIDIDNFRLVNDIYGQNTGDDLLNQVAAAIQRNTRNIDTVGRLGGDEFGVLLPQTDSDGARLVSKRIQDLLTELVVTHRWPISFSIVLVTFTKPPASTREMTERADKLMNSVKKSGKNSIAFESWPETNS